MSVFSIIGFDAVWLRQQIGLSSQFQQPFNEGDISAAFYGQL